MFPDLLTHEIWFRREDSSTAKAAKKSEPISALGVLGALVVLFGFLFIIRVDLRPSAVPLVVGAT